MLVAKVTCVWLSPSVSVHVLEEPAGFKYDVCAGMLTLSSTIQTCVAVKKKQKKKLDYQWCLFIMQSSGWVLETYLCPPVLTLAAEMSDIDVPAAGEEISVVWSLLRETVKETVCWTAAHNMRCCCSCVCESEGDNPPLQLRSLWIFSHTVYLTW